MSLNGSLQYLTVICNTKSESEIVGLLRENDGYEIQIIYGHGSANRGLFARALGFDVEERKAIIYCIVPTEKAAKLMDILCNEYRFNEENTGVAFCTEIQSIAF